MENKKKLTIALFSVCAAVIIGLIVAVSVLAAATHNFNSAVNVTFKATSIKGSVTGKYQVATDAAVDMTNPDAAEGEDNKVFSFDATDSTKTGSLQMSAITLTETKNYVTFTYTLTSTGDKAYNATVLYNDTNEDDKNVTVEYKVGDAATWTTLGDDGATARVDANGSNTVAIKVTVPDTGKDATFTGTFAWTLTGITE